MFAFADIAQAVIIWDYTEVKPIPGLGYEYNSEGIFYMWKMFHLWMLPISVISASSNDYPKPISTHICSVSNAVKNINKKSVFSNKLFVLQTGVHQLLILMSLQCVLARALRDRWCYQLPAIEGLNPSLTAPLQCWLPPPHLWILSWLLPLPLVRTLSACRRIKVGQFALCCPPPLPERGVRAGSAWPVV